MYKLLLTLIFLTFVMTCCTQDFTVDEVLLSSLAGFISLEVENYSRASFWEARVSNNGRSEDISSWHPIDLISTSGKVEFGPLQVGSWSIEVRGANQTTDFDTQKTGLKRLYEVGYEISIEESSQVVVLDASEDFHEHSYSSDWTSNETHHWHAATCIHSDLKSNETEHRFGGVVILTDSTSEQAGAGYRECQICNFRQTVTIPLANHVHNEDIRWWEKSVVGTVTSWTHWHKCTCSAVSTKEEQTLTQEIVTEATENSDGLNKFTCPICNEVRYASISSLTSHSHVYSRYLWTLNSSNQWIHWHECNCGLKEDQVVSATNVYTCSVCNTSRSAVLNPELGIVLSDNSGKWLKVPIVKIRNCSVSDNESQLYMTDGSGIDQGYYIETTSFQTGQKIKYYPVAIKNSASIPTPVSMEVKEIGIIDELDGGYVWDWKIVAEDGQGVPSVTTATNECSVSFARSGLYEVHITVRKASQINCVAEVRFGLDVVSQRPNETYNISEPEEKISGSYCWFLSGDGTSSAYTKHPIL